MASSLFSFLVVFLSVINLSHAGDLVTKVCSRTLNKPLCFKTLNSDPRSATADLKGLGSISIQKSQDDAKRTCNYVESLSKQAGSNIKLKNRYDTCAENYDDTISNLGSAGNALTASDIGSYRTYASAALDGPSTCKDSFKGPPSAPTQLQEANKNSQGLISITLAVGALLEGEK